MPDYKYSALNKNGKTVKGILTVIDEDDLKRQLKSDGKILISAKQIKGNSSIKLFKRMTKKIIDTAELSNFCRQLSIVIKSGVSIMTALESMIEQTANKDLKTELTRLYNGMQTGRMMSDIMGDKDSKFPLLTSSMISAGEASGTLEKVLSNLSEYYLKESLIKKKIKSAMIYPIMLLCMTFIMIIGFMKFILPNIIEIITVNNGELPAITKFVIALSNIIGKYYILIIAAICIIALGLKTWFKTEKGRVFKDNLILHLPVIGKTVRDIITTRFSQSMYLFTESGFPIAKGLELIEQTVNNVFAEKAIKKALKGIQQGEELVENLGKETFFSKLFLQMLSVGERTGSMSTVTKEITSYYEREVELGIAKITSLIEPTMMIVIGSIVGFLIVSVALPMFTVYNNIG